MGIGVNLKIALKEYDLTVAELSRETGVSTNTLYAMIRRDNQKIDPEMLKKICDNSEITVYDLLDDYEDYIAKYYDTQSSESELKIADYVLTQIGNDNQLGEIVEIYEELNNDGKFKAWERIKELKEIPRYIKSDNE